MFCTFPPAHIPSHLNLQSLQHEGLLWDTLTLDVPLPHHTSGTRRLINESIRNSCDQQTPQISPWTWGILRGWGKESLLLSRLLGVESIQLGRWHLPDDPPKKNCHWCKQILHLINFKDLYSNYIILLGSEASLQLWLITSYLLLVQSQCKCVGFNPLCTANN